MNQLYWIRRRFGFENNSVAVLISNEMSPVTERGLSDYLEWARSVVGRNAYFGTILDILQGLPVQYFVMEEWQRIEIAPADVKNRTIILPDKWYDVTSLEKAISREISGGIYELLTTNITEIESKIFHVARFFLSNTNMLFRVAAGWDNFYWDLQNNSQLILWLRPKKVGEWFAIESDLTRFIGF